MSKRKTTAGGYSVSSDGPDEEPELHSENPTKKSKFVPYAPPRLSVTLFQFPRSSSASNPSAPSSVVPASSMPLQPEQPATSEPVSQQTQADMSKTSNDPLSTTHKLTIARSNLSLERQVNELATTLEDFKSSNCGAFDPCCGPGGESSSRSVSIGPSPTDAHVYLSNPMPTPELISIVSKAANEARSCVGKKKGGGSDNSKKEHARTTFYRLLDIPNAKSIRPYFEDEHGEPDTLPSAFVDPDTNYCQPFPHWKAPLVKQVAWVPTYILRFRSTIPNDRSELSNLLRGLSDEEIVVLLHDGPFKSAQTAWRDMKKTDAEIEAMKAEAHRYQRINKKASTRGAYIRTIPSLQAPEWEYLSHPGYMSSDESDGEGGLVTKRPGHRAQWETNLYEAIAVAELEKAQLRPGLCPQPPSHLVELVKRPIPHLERGTGNNKVTIRTAFCGLKKSWREQHPDELRKYSHLLNLKITKQPDIIEFLAKHPKPNGGDNWDGNCGDCVTSGGEGEEINRGEAIAQVHGSAQDEEESQVDLGAPPLPEDYNQRILAGDFGGFRPLGWSASKERIGDIPIDPQILGDEASNNAGQPGYNTQQVLETGVSDTRPPSSPESPLEPTNRCTSTATMLDGPLEPPPPPDPVPGPAAGSTPPEAKSRRPPRKRGQAGGKGPVQGELADHSAIVTVTPACAPPPFKKRGRPAGSKNNKKA